MRRWTSVEKEWLGYRRKLANNMKVSLKKAPWEKSSIELKTESEKDEVQKQSKSNRTRKEGTKKVL
tara:strand:- start:47 stop:244 length:198 start_codon:yes stop_codon:yes gene_type:complete